MTDDEAWALEESLWLGGIETFEARLAPACIMAFPSIGILEAAQIPATLAGTHRWEKVEMVGRSLGRPDEGTIVLGYEALARRPQSDPYRAFCASVWRNLEGG